MKKTEAVGILKALNSSGFRDYVKPRLLRFKELRQVEYNKANKDNFEYLKAKMDATNELLSYLEKLTSIAKKKVSVESEKKLY